MMWECCHLTTYAKAQQLNYYVHMMRMQRVKEMWSSLDSSPCSIKTEDDLAQTGSSSTRAQFSGNSIWAMVVLRAGRDRSFIDLISLPKAKHLSLHGWFLALAHIILCCTLPAFSFLILLCFFCFTQSIDRCKKGLLVLTWYVLLCFLPSGCNNITPSDPY